MNIVNIFIVSLSFFSFNALAAYNMHKNIINNGYKICIIGDTGTGSDKQKLMGTLLAKENCNQVRLLGDIIYPSGLKGEFDAGYFDKFYVPFKDVIESKHHPLFHIIVGNHADSISG